MSSFSIILDVRSGSVGAAAVVPPTPKSPATVLCAMRTTLPILAEFEVKRATEQIGAGIKETLTEIRKSVPGKAREVVAFIGTPWFISQTRTAVYKAEKPFECSKKFLDRLQKDEVAAFVHEHFPDGTVDILEQIPVQTLLNGYPTDKPLGKTASEAAAAFFVSAASHEFVELVEKQIRSVYHSNIRYHTFAHASLFVAQRTLLSATPTFVYVDIGGEVSELSLVEAGCIKEAISFPMGSHSVVREIGKFFSSTPEESRSMYQAYIEHRVSESVALKVEKVLEDVRLKWATYVKSIIDKLLISHLLPPLYIVIGNPETSQIFCETLRSAELAGSMKQNKISCVTLSPELLRDHFAGASKGTPDIFLGLEALFLDKNTSLTYNNN